MFLIATRVKQRSRHTPTMAASFWSRIMKFPRTISLIATGLATLLLAACSSTPDASAAVEKTCRVYDAQNSMQLHASQASGERKAGDARGERKPGDARALGTLQRMRGHGGAGNTLIDDLLRECS
jgi:hypothetical protein